MLRLQFMILILIDIKHVSNLLNVHILLTLPCEINQNQIIKIQIFLLNLPSSESTFEGISPSMTLCL